jgi:glycosyltransferase involved in cell wall biosynthesis
MAVHAARGEGFSLAILEYMSAGLATLVPDIPSVRQAIDPGVTGLVYPDADADATARILLDLLVREDARSALGRAASEKVESEYSLDHSARVFRSVVQDAL